jgi:hypothetical protein
VRLITQYNRISRLLVLGQEFQDLIALASVSVARSASPGGFPCGAHDTSTQKLLEDREFHLAL